VSWLSGKRSDMVSRSKGGVSGLGLNWGHCEDMDSACWDM
jgi:hypothetical protein